MYHPPLTTTFNDLINRLKVEDQKVWWVLGGPATGKTTVARALAQKTGRYLLSFHDVLAESFNEEAFMGLHQCRSEVVFDYMEQEWREEIRSRIFRCSKPMIVDGFPLSTRQITALNQRKGSEIVLLTPGHQHWERYTSGKERWHNTYHNFVRHNWNRDALEKALKGQNRFLVRSYTNEEDLSGTAT